MEMMSLSEIVSLFVNNSVAIAVIIYFCIRDWKFMNTLVETLATIKEMLNDIEKEGGKTND